MQDWILRAIDLANTGHQQEALTVLRTILQRDNRRVDALKWLAFLTPDAYEAFVAARHILTIDPDDAWAQQAVGPLRARYERTRAAAPPAPLPAPAPIPQQRARRSAFPAALAMAGVLLCVGAVTLAALGSVALPGRSQPTAVSTSADAIALPMSTSAPLMVTAPAQPTDVQQASLNIDPQVIVTTQSEYYSFEASDVAGVQQALYTQGPATGEPGGERSIAMTSYRIWMEWSAYETPSTCQLGHATIHLDLTYTYPRWIPHRRVRPYPVRRMGRLHPARRRTRGAPRADRDRLRAASFTAAGGCRRAAHLHRHVFRARRADRLGLCRMPAAAGRLRRGRGPHHVPAAVTSGTFHPCSKSDSAGRIWQQLNLLRCVYACGIGYNLP